MIPRAFQFFSKLRADAATAGEHVISIGHLVATSPHPALCRVPFTIMDSFFAIIRRFLDEGALGLASWPLARTDTQLIDVRNRRVRRSVTNYVRRIIILGLKRFRIPDNCVTHSLQRACAEIVYGWSYS